MNPHDWRDGIGHRPPLGPAHPGMVEKRQIVFETPTPTTVPVPPPTEETEDEAETEHIVRPFIVTGGRTRPTIERLRVETLVTALPAALSAPLSFERRHIVEVCQRPLSVAEIANSLDVPVGVAKVLIADLIAERFITVHDHLGMQDFPSRALLERIRDGVRAL